MAYPSVVATFTNPQATDRLNSPSHSSIHGAVNDEVLQLETFVGTLSSAIGTLVYDIRAAASNGGGHVQTASKGGTGQTTFTTGDILVATNSSVLSKLAIGTLNGYALVVDSTQAAGLKWGVPGNSPSILAVNTASVFTYIKPSTVSYLRVRQWGGGGGPGTGAFGGAGGGGGYSEKIIPASSVAGTVTVVVGGGGQTGSVGGTTAFGSIFTAAGGGLGTPDPGSGAVTGAASGGVGSGGDINLTGETSAETQRTAALNNVPGGLAPLGGVAGKGASSKGNNVAAVVAQPGMIIIETY